MHPVRFGLIIRVHAPRSLMGQSEAAVVLSHQSARGWAAWVL